MTNVMAVRLCRCVFISLFALAPACGPGDDDGGLSASGVARQAGTTAADFTLILAPRAFESEVLRLQSFKYETGVVAFAVYLDDVYAHYPGRDEPEKVKNCIAHWAKYYHVKSVMLVGDVDRFPVRYVSRYLESYTPSDLYYADLWRADGSFSSWDANGDGVFGEMTHSFNLFINVDGMDWRPDVAVGRVPASTLTELRRFVDKVIRYERAQTHPGWFNPYKRAILATGSWGDDKATQDKIAKSYLHDFIDVEKVYYPAVNAAATFDQRAQTMSQHIDRGAGLINYLGHGNTEGFVWVYDHHHLDGLRDGHTPPIVFSNGCNTGGFAPVPPFHEYVDRHGIKRPSSSHLTSSAHPAPVQPSSCAGCDREAGPEHWLVKRETGGVGYVGPVGAGNPPYAFQMSEFFFASYEQGARTFGDLWKGMIERYVARHTDATGDIVYGGGDAVWHQRAIWNMLTEFNAFGDPSLRLGGYVPDQARVALSPRLGCFRDRSDRDLWREIAADAQMTAERCVLLCKDRGHLYAGVQNGNQCFCGNSYGKHGASNSCSKACSGDATQTCGGPWSNEVYAISLGCFKDSASGRDLEVAGPAWPTMTVEQCLGFCKGEGYRYAGVQYGKQCFCGNSYGGGGPATSCDMPCAGDADQRCGGYWTNNVFPVSLGCYKDSSSRDLPFKVAPAALTVPSCIATCKAQGYRYAGLQNGNECFCGYNYGAHGPSSNCNRPCADAASQLCGGPWANEVYPVN